MKTRLMTYTAVALFATACSDITELNVDTKRPTSIPAETLITSAEKQLSDNLASSSVNTNIFRLLSQQWTQTTYTDESNYDLATRNIPQTMWHNYYRDVLRDLLEAKNIITADISVPAGVKTNQLAIEEILEIYSYSVLVTTFGDIPYTQALDANNPQPTYDDAKTVHADLLKRIDAAIAKFDVAEGSFGGSDLLFGGDVAKWKTFANSLKLRLGMIIADVDPATAKTVVESAAKGAITSPEDDALFYYLGAPPNTNPVWVDLVQSGRKDYVASNTMLNMLVSLNDPRVGAFYTTDAKGGYSGGTYGASNNYATFSKIGSALLSADLPNSLIDCEEVEFLLAEAVERGFNVGGTAAEHYNKAIKASFGTWGISDADYATYIAQPSVAYATATGDWKQKIGTQKWLASYNRGFVAWTEWRRLDYPALKPGANALTGIPVRYTYPVSEQNLNKANFTSAASAIGGDKISTKLFWDKF